MKYFIEGVSLAYKIPVLCFGTIIVFLLLSIAVIAILKYKTRLRKYSRIGISIVVSGITSVSLLSTFLEVTQWI